MAIKEPSTAKPDNGEAQPTPFYRRRSVQAGGGALLALLTAGGLFAGLKPSHQSEKAPQPTPTTAPANTPSPSSTEKQSSTPPPTPTKTEVASSAFNPNVDFCGYPAALKDIEQIVGSQITCDNTNHYAAHGGTAEGSIDLADGRHFTLGIQHSDAATRSLEDPGYAKKISIDGNDCYLSGGGPNTLCNEFDPEGEGYILGVIYSDGFQVADSVKIAKIALGMAGAPSEYHFS